MAKAKAKTKSQADTNADLAAQRDHAQYLLNKGTMRLPGGKTRPLTDSERAAFERVIARTGKILKPAPSPPRKPKSDEPETPSTTDTARKAWEVAKAAKKRYDDFKKMPGRMPKDGG